MHSRRTPLPPVHPADPIWTAEHIALALRQEIRATRTLIARPDFPPAFRTTDAANTRKYWLRETVLAYLPTLHPTPAASASPAAAASTPAPVEHTATDSEAQATSDPHVAALAKIAALPRTSTRRSA